MVQTLTIPAPTKGLNYINDPTSLDPQEALQLDNYLVYEGHIRQRGKSRLIATLSGGTQRFLGVITSYIIPSTGVEALLVCTDTRVNKIASVSEGATVTDKTNAVAFTATFSRHLHFNNSIFLVNGTDAGAIYDIATETLSAVGTTPNMSTFNFLWSFNGRLFGVVKNSASYYYGELGEVAGTLTEVDLSSVISQTGILIWGASWPVNQGTENIELMALGFSSGEILIYAGSFPDSSDWRLVNRVFGPAPIIAPLAQNNASSFEVARFGQDILIHTRRGIISLSSIVAARSPTDSLFNLSAKLGNYINDTTAVFKMALDTRGPFLYSLGSSTEQFPYSGDDGGGLALYALNYEQGAWSRLVFGPDTNDQRLFGVAFCGGYLILGQTFPNVAPTIRYVDHNVSETDSNNYFQWTTGFLDFGTPLQKTIKYIRSWVRKWIGTAYDLYVATQVTSDVEQATFGTTDSNTTSPLNGKALFAELTTAPNGIGRFLAIRHTHQAGTPSNSSGIDIAKVQVLYDELKGVV